MFSSGPNYNKLKTNCRLSMNRIKLLGKKKTEQAQKARKEIADYIGQGKEDRARIRVEHIIREDYLVEALEMIEMFCDLLIARFGLLQTMKEMDPGLEECIATLIYCTPRLQSDIPELKIVCDQLTLKYKKEFADYCLSNKLNNVNEKVLHRLAATPPPKILVERYLIEIARSHNVPFEPDPKVMQEDEIALAENQLGQLIDFQGLSEKNPNALPNNGVLPDAGSGPAYPPPPGGMPFGPAGPGGPGAPGGPGGAVGSVPFHGPGGVPFHGPGGAPYHGPGGAPNGLPYPPANIPDAALYPPDQKGPGYPPSSSGGYQGPPANGAGPMPPSYNETMWNDPGSASPGGPPPLPSKGPAGGDPNSSKPPTSNFSLPDLPGVPDSGLPHIPSPPRSGGVTPLGGPPGGGGGNDDVDLDDLTRRFEELKKRK